MLEKLDTENGTRRTVKVRPMTPEEVRAHEDSVWAAADPEVLDKYEGQLVVPFQGKIVAYGTEMARVLEDAVRATGCPQETLPVISIGAILHDPLH